MKLPVYKERYNIVISTQTSNRLAVAEYILQTKHTAWNVLASTEITVLAFHCLYLRIVANTLRLPPIVLLLLRLLPVILILVLIIFRYRASSTQC